MAQKDAYCVMTEMADLSPHPKLDLVDDGVQFLNFNRRNLITVLSYLKWTEKSQKKVEKMSVHYFCNWRKSIRKVW